MTVSPLFFLLAGVVSMNPSSSALPGRSTIQQLTNGLGWWALVASLVGLVLGAAAWALGSHTNTTSTRTPAERRCSPPVRRSSHRGRTDARELLVPDRPWDPLTILIV